MNPDPDTIGLASPAVFACPQGMPVTVVGSALAAIGLTGPRPVLILVGGAANLDEGVAVRLRPLFRDLVPVLDRLGAAVIDGGTHVGVMALMGEARQRASGCFPLIGIAPRGRVKAPARCSPDCLDESQLPVAGSAGLIPGSTANGGPVTDRRFGSAPERDAGKEPRVALDPHHSHFLLVPGYHWGDESPWLMAAADWLASGARTLMLVAGGGEITRRDVQCRLGQAGRVLALAGSGGTADALVAWRRGEGPPPWDAQSVLDPAMIEVLDWMSARDQLLRLVAQAIST